MTNLTWYWWGYLDLLPEGQLFRKTFIPVQPNTCFVDRTETIVFPIRTSVSPQNAIPDYPLENIRLIDCVQDAVECLDKENKNIYVMWSGGIDSTLMLASLINLKVNPEKITVICNNDSLRENYEFYKTQIRGKIKIISTELFTHDIKYKVFDGIVIQAEHADLLFPSNITGQMKFWIDEEFLKLPASRENILKFLRAKKYDDISANCLYDLVMLSSAKSPRPIETNTDFAWWINFNLRWQNNHEKFRARINLKNDYRTFFSTPMFQQWSMANVGTSDLTNKNGFRDLLKVFYNNPDYSSNKAKWASMSKHFATRSAHAITENNEAIYKEFNVQDYYVANNFFSERL